MLDFITQYGWEIFVAADLLILLLVIYFVKERQENKRIQGMQTDQVSIDMRTNENNEVTEKFQPKKKRKSMGNKMLMSTGTLGGVNWSSKKSMEVILTESLINQLRSIHTGGFFVRKIISKFIPEQVIEELMKKALAGQLKPGDKVKIDKGKLEIIPQ